MVMHHGQGYLQVDSWQLQVRILQKVDDDHHKPQTVIAIVI